MWSVFLAMTRVETADVRNGNVTITREVQSVGASRSIISSHYSLDALTVRPEVSP